MSAPDFEGFRKVTGEEAPLFLSLGVLYSDWEPYFDYLSQFDRVESHLRMEKLMDYRGIQFYIKVEEDGDVQEDQP